ncbi:Netrin-G1 [Chelonia mydas]|uniref:Netrin-G1 n=1 Tax=Chelonia mydas TaxID=8469 RepID=M7CGP3_CHEMY|nr:Netrin-G1 [Chelonia mydas]
MACQPEARDMIKYVKVTLDPPDITCGDPPETFCAMKTSGLSTSSLKVHLTAITAFHHKIDNIMVFAHPITKKFLKGIQMLYPDVKLPVAPWDLHLVLKALMDTPFEPMATRSLLHLSMKTAFLIEITSARQVGEMGALMADPPYTMFFRDKVTLLMHPRFFPKVHSSFHLNEPIHLPTFFPKPHANAFETIMHALDVLRALSFYLDRTKQFRKTPRLFLSATQRSQGNIISTQRLSKWIADCIRLCYQLRQIQSPMSIRTLYQSCLHLYGLSLQCPTV